MCELVDCGEGTFLIKSRDAPRPRGSLTVTRIFVEGTWKEVRLAVEETPPTNKRLKRDYKRLRDENGDNKPNKRPLAGDW